LIEPKSFDRKLQHQISEMNPVKMLTGYEHITKFNGSNFPSWKVLIWDAFQLNDVCPFSLGLETNECTSDSGISVSDQLILPSYSRKNVSWNKNDIAARVLIAATVEDKWQRQLSNCSSAREMWMTIERCHRHYLSVNGYAIQQKFFNYRYNEGSDIKTMIGEIEALANQLSDMGQPVTEFQMISKILGTLPKKLRHFTSMWQMLPDEEKTLTQLNLHLLRLDSAADDSMEDTIEEDNTIREMLCENDSISAISFRSASSTTISADSIHMQRKRKMSPISDEAQANKRSEFIICDKEVGEDKEQERKEEKGNRESIYIDSSYIIDTSTAKKENTYHECETLEEVILVEDSATQTEQSETQDQLNTVDKDPLDQGHTIWIEDVLH